MESSDNPCDPQIHRGPKAASEPETQHLMNFLEAHKDYIKSYVTLHSNVQMLLYPWGNKLPTHPADVEDLVRNFQTVNLGTSKIRNKFLPEIFCA